MPNLYFRNTGDVNWGTATNWSLTDGGGATGTVPTSTDDVFFTANSGNCDINQNSSGRAINFTGYSNTLNFPSASFTLNANGNVTLSPSMLFGAPTSTGLRLNATSTLTSNGRVWEYGLFFGSGSTTYTLADNWTVTGTVTFNGTQMILNDNSLFISGSLSVPNGSNNIVSGNTSLIINGTGTWTSNNGTIRNNLTINTTGTFTISGVVNYANGTLTYIANTGTVITTNSTLKIGFTNANTTLNTSGMSWWNVYSSQDNTITLTSDLNVDNAFRTDFGGFTVNGVYNVNVKGNLEIGYPLSGTSTIKLNGTGDQTWLNVFANNYVSSNLVVDKPSGSLTISGTVYYETKTFTYLQGTIAGSGTILFRNATLNLGTNKINANVALVGNITLSSNATFVGNLTTQTTAVVFSGSFAVNAEGNLTINTSTSGSNTLIIINGTGSQTWTSAAYLLNSLRIDKPSGTLSLSSNTYYQTGTLSYISGTVSTTGNTLNIGNSCGLDTGGITWNNFICDMPNNVVSSAYPGGTINLSSNLNINGNISIGSSTVGGNSTGLPIQTITFSTSNGSQVISSSSSNITIGVYSSSIGVAGSVLVNFPTNTNLSANNLTLRSGYRATGGPDIAFFTTVNNVNFNVGGTFSMLALTATSIITIFSGNSSSINMIGNGNMIHTGVSLNYITIPINLNSSGSYNISSTNASYPFQIRNTRLSYNSGTFSGVLWINGCNVDFNSNLRLNADAFLLGTIILSRTASLTNLTTTTSPVSISGTGSVNVGGNLTVNTTTTGTSSIILDGTSSQIWSATSYLNNNLSINKSSGTFSVSGNVYYQTGTFSFSSGNYSTTGSTLNLGSSCTVDSNGLIWNNVTNTATATINLPTNLVWTGTYSITGNTIGFTGSGSLTASTGNLLANGSSTTNFNNDIQVVNATLGPATLNRNTIYLTGNLNTTGNTTGTSSIIMVGLGTQTWSSSANAYLNNNLKIDKPSGILNIIGNIYYQSGTFSFASGSYSTTGSTLNLGTSCRIDSNNLIWNNITNTTSAIIDLPSSMAWGGTWSVTSGSLTFSGIGSLTASTSGNAAISGSSIVSLKNDIQVVNAILGIATINNSNMSITGNLTINNTTSGTTTLLINGTTSQLWTSSAYLSNNLTINKISGTLSLSSNTYYQTGTLSYISGSVSTTGNTLNIGGSTFLSTSGIQWNIFACSATSTITLNSDLYVGNSFNIGTSVARSVTFTGPGMITTTQYTNIRIGNSLWAGSNSQNPAVGNTILTFNNPQVFSINNLTIETNADGRYFIPGIGYNITSGSVPYSLNINNATFYVYGTFSVGWYNEGVATGYQPNSFTSSNTTVITKGSGNIFVSGNGSYRNQIPLTIDAIDTYAFTSSALSTVTFTNTTINYLAGTVSGLPVTFDTCSLNFPVNRRWGTDVQLSGSTVISTTSSFGNLTTQTSTVAMTGTGSINVAGNLAINVVTTGVTKPIIINGTGSQTWSATSYLSNDLSINKTSGTLTISGNVYYQSGTLSYVSGTVSAINSTLNIGGSTNLQTEPIQWFNINNPAAATVNLVNNLSFTGTWSAAAGVISYTGSGILSPTSSSRINFSGTSNVTVPDSVNGITMSSITLTTSGTTQLRGTISCSGLLTLGGSGAINNASGFTGFIRTGGGLSMAGNASGTATIILTGGTWSASGANYLLTNVNLDGNIRIGSNIYYATGTMSYISGNIDTSTNFSTLTISGTTKIDTSNINWYNVFFVTSGTINLQSNLLVNNIFRITQVDQTFTTNTNSVINCGHFQYVITSSTTHNVNMSNIPVYTRDFTASGLGSGAALSINNNTFVSGDLTVTGGFGHGAHLYGGTISMVGSGTITTTSAIKSNLIINTGGKINITGTYFLGSQNPAGSGGANMTYIKGNVVAKGATLSMVTNASYPYILTGMNKIAWRGVLITSGANITMNEFFSGTPDVKTTILPSSTGTYSVTFTDNFEKVARYVNPTNLWVRPGQLLITTDGKKSFSTNRGIRYINSNPNGLSKNTNLTSPQLGTFLLNDPTMTKF